MFHVELARAARADLVDIAEYTLDRWGDTQAERYIAALHRRIRWLRRNAGRGRACPGLSPEYRNVREGRHVIYFQLREEGVLVVRILHERMLPRLHLRSGR